jgi:hypothetical protein
VVGFQGRNGIVRIDHCELHVPETYRVLWLKAGSKNTRLILGPCAKDGKVVVFKAAAASAPAVQIVDLRQLLPNGLKDGLIKLGSK